MKKNYFAIFLLLLVFVPGLAAPLSPAQADDALWNKQIGREDIGKAFGQDTANPRDVRDVTVQVVKVFLTFLALIVVIMIILGGFRWMTAAGNEERVKDAKHMIRSAVIGLVIILSAFAILEFTYELFYEFFED
jgi:uncharacterized membrane protein YidH (DUF202 family)